MRAPVRHIHRIGKWIVAGLTGAVIVPVLGQFAINYVESRGWYKHPDSVVANVSAFLNSLTGSPWFHWIGGGVIGLCAGLWLDFLVVRTTNKPVAVEAEAIAVTARRTVLRLLFSGKTEPPKSLYEENILSWFAFWSPSGGACTPEGEVLFEIPASWAIFVTFERPTKYHQIIVNFVNDRPQSYEVRQQLESSAVVTITGGIPACEMEMITRQREGDVT